MSYMAEKTKPKELQVNMPQELRKGVYANVVNISITNTECVLNFIYKNEMDTPNGTLVSRVVIPRKLATELPKMMKDIVVVANEKDNNG